MEAHPTTAAVQVHVEGLGHEGPSTSQPVGPAQAPPAEHLVLKLVPKKKKKKTGKVKWTDETVDNEFMGKKKSKKCCMFHKQRSFGEWSDGEDSDSGCEECNQNQNQPPV